MSDVMFYGVLRMPYELAMGDELSRRQFYSRSQGAVDRVEAADKRIAELGTQLAEWTEAAMTREALLQRVQTELTQLLAAAAAPTDSRADFEAHFKLCIRQQARYSVGDYRDADIQSKWEGWQAAKGEGE